MRGSKVNDGEGTPSRKQRQKDHGTRTNYAHTSGAAEPQSNSGKT